MNEWAEGGTAEENILQSREKQAQIARPRRETSKQHLTTTCCSMASPTPEPSSASASEDAASEASHFTGFIDAEAEEDESDGEDWMWYIPLHNECGTGRLSLYSLPAASGRMRSGAVILPARRSTFRLHLPTPGGTHRGEGYGAVPADDMILEDYSDPLAGMYGDLGIVEVQSGKKPKGDKKARSRRPSSSILWHEMR